MRYLIKNNQGTSLITAIIYIVITGMLIFSLSNLIIGSLNSKKQISSADTINHNARFILNYITNRVHNVEYITDVNPDPEQLMFYNSSTERFGLTIEDDDLAYRMTEDSGGGFPAQSTATPVILNSAAVKVSNLVLNALDDYAGNPNKGLSISFNLSISTSTNPFKYLSKDYSTFISIR